MKTRMICTTLSAALLLGGAAIAQAQEARTSYRPYEIATIEGQRAVVARIENTAKQACRGGMSLQGLAESRTCTVELTRQMVVNSGSPTLVALWSGSNLKLASRDRRPE